MLAAGLKVVALKMGCRAKRAPCGALNSHLLGTFKEAEANSFIRW